MGSRKREFFFRYLFKKPVFLLLLAKVIKPFLSLFIREDRMLYKIIMYLLEMQSIITLTL